MHRYFVGRFLLFLILLGSAAHIFAAKTFDFNTHCQLASEALLRLDFNEVDKQLEVDRSNGKDNLALVLLEFQKRAIQVFITDSRPGFEALKIELDNYIELAQDLDPASPYCRYLQAEFYFLESVLRFKFEEHYMAAAHIRKGYKLIQENADLFPGFLPNNKYIGLIHAAIGMVPEQYRWLTSLAGFNGNLAQGIGELQKLANNASDSIYLKYEQEQADMMLVFILLNFKQDIPQAKFYADKLDNQQAGPLRAFMRANVALHAGENDEAIRVLEMNRKLNSKALPYLDFMLGAAKLCRMDKDANIYLEKFISEYKGQNYVKAANQKLAWYYLLQNDINHYEYYRDRVLMMGVSVIDEDKQALLEAQSKVKPNIKLLRARLLFDGGYTKKSLAVFLGADVKSDFPNLKDQLEVTYRIARIYHKLGQTSKAIGYYQETLKNGYQFSYYFAANASLQLGLLYEDMDDFTKAKYYFEKCLHMRNHEYQNSLDQKARAGLERIAVK